MQKVMSGIFAGIDKVSGFMRWPGLVLLIIMVLITNFEVVMRYVVNKPTMWTLEGTQMLQVVFAMMRTGDLVSDSAVWNAFSISSKSCPLIRITLNPYDS